MSEDGISENSAENQPERGRPRQFSLLWEQFHAANDHRLREGTHRTGVSKMWAFEALRCIVDNPQPSLEWLVEESRSPRGWRKTLLSELGRIEDAETILAVAREICDLNPKTRDAIAMIWSSRLGRFPEASPRGLESAIAAAVESYVMAHSEISMNQIAAVLDNLADHFEEGEEDHPSQDRPARSSEGSAEAPPAGAPPRRASAGR
jgi:hypothetical protein